jgi:hypothetical protein
LDLRFQYKRKSSRCQQSHDEQSLFPGANQPSQQDEEQSIGFRTCSLFHLPLEDDELLAQEDIFLYWLLGSSVQKQAL